MHGAAESGHRVRRDTKLYSCLMSDLGGLNRDALLTIRELEMFFDGRVTYRCIDGWIRRQKLTSHGRNERGQLLIRVGDALQVEADTHRAKRGRPRKTRPASLFTSSYL